MAPCLPLDCKGGCEFALKTDFVHAGGMKDACYAVNSLPQSICLRSTRLPNAPTLERCAEYVQNQEVWYDEEQ
jgi:hypothetical protein